MKYKIAICDDSEADRQIVLDMVRHWAAGVGHVVHIDTFTSAENFLFHYAEESDYDILLLDIEMGAMDGVTMAKRVRKDNEAVQIVFITGFDDYISEGYEVSALHYLMKPVRQEKLSAVLNRAAAAMHSKDGTGGIAPCGRRDASPIGGADRVCGSLFPYRCDRHWDRYPSSQDAHF